MRGVGVVFSGRVSWSMLGHKLDHAILLVFVHILAV